MADEDTRTSGPPILVVWLAGIAFLEFFQSRITPPGGFTRQDYVLMVLVPLGSLVAGYHWRYRPVHFIFGCAAALLFIPAQVYGGRYALSLWMPVERNLWAITLGWGAFIVGMGLACRLASSVWPRPRHIAGFCSQCGYDLTGNVSGVCPECGTPISR